TLSTSPAGGMSDSATVFAQQARAAGVTINLDVIPADSYYGSQYLKYAFGQTGWADRPIPLFFQLALTSDAPYNETHWKRPDWDRTFRQASAITDPAKRKQIYDELQKELWNQGGYIQWGDNSELYATTMHVKGLTRRKGRLLGNYDMRKVQLV